MRLPHACILDAVSLNSSKRRIRCPARVQSTAPRPRTPYGRKQLFRMCGIAGIVGAPGANYDKNVERMLGSISHRGPDGTGTAALGSCVLGHVRLSIVDIGGSAQPMLSADRSKGLSFNGEIYGYQRLRRKYSYPFVTDGD